MIDLKVLVLESGMQIYSKEYAYSYADAFLLEQRRIRQVKEDHADWDAYIKVITVDCTTDEVISEVVINKGEVTRKEITEATITVHVKGTHEAIMAFADDLVQTKADDIISVRLEMEVKKDD